MCAKAFDQEQAIEILESFNSISGLGTTLFSAADDDNSVEVLFTKDACNEMCPFCSPIEGELWRPPCQRVHAQAARFADRFGGRYFYQCKEDRIFFSAPIVNDGGMVATMTVGPVHIFEVEEAHNRDPRFRSFPVRKPKYVQYLSNLLSSCAVCVSDSSQSHLRALKQASLEQQSRIHSSVSQYKNEPFREYPIDREDQLCRAIEEADASSARLILNEMLGIMLSSSYMSSRESFRQRIKEIKDVCAHAAIRAGVGSESVFSACANYSEIIRTLKTNEQLCLHAQTFVEHMVSMVERLKEIDYQDDIYRATEYIRTHCNMHLTLTDVANQIHFSPSYFSRLFKKKVGCNFSEYLNRVRIDASKNSLLTTDLPASEIARLVGYEDPSYFTRVFKRIVGVSPGYYRSHRGQFERSKEHG